MLILNVVCCRCRQIPVSPPPAAQTGALSLQTRQLSCSTKAIRPSCCFFTLVHTLCFHFLFITYQMCKAQSKWVHQLVLDFIMNPHQNRIKGKRSYKIASVYMFVCFLETDVDAIDVCLEGRFLLVCERNGNLHLIYVPHKKILLTRV